MASHAAGVAQLSTADAAPAAAPAAAAEADAAPADAAKRVRNLQKKLRQVCVLSNLRWGVILLQSLPFRQRREYDCSLASL